jgi:hypothetical protein
VIVQFVIGVDSMVDQSSVKKLQGKAVRVVYTAPIVFWIPITVDKQ